MQQHLAKYFSLHRKLILPGIGLFVEERRPAHLEFVDKLLHAPVTSVTFLNDEDVEDPAFPVFLGSETGTENTTAINKYEAFIAQFKTALNLGEKLNVAGLGIIEKTDTGYAFTAEDVTKVLFTAVTAERIIRQNAQHNVLVGEDEKTSVQMQEILHQEIVKDKWWIAAVVLAVIGIAAIVYYYLTRPS